MKLKISCDWCGKEFEKYSCVITKHNFCSRSCLAAYSNKQKNPNGYMNLKDYTNMAANFSKLAKELNPTRMTIETRAKIRKARLNSGKGISYVKLYGRHEHRIVAEKILGRPLKDGEVVHHIDGNKRNSDIDNIQIFPSQREHARYHAKLSAFFKAEGGGAK